MLWVCSPVWSFPVPSSSASQKAAAQVAAHPALAVKEVVRIPGSVVSHRSLRIPGGTSRRPVPVQVAAHCCRCVWILRVTFWGWGKTDETSTLSTGTGGGAGGCRGGWFPRHRLESSTCRDSKSTSSRDRTPALDE